MLLTKFDYFEPQDLSELYSFLEQHEGEAKILSGGTDLLIMMKQKVTSPKYIINIKQLKQFNFIDYSIENGLRIGCLTTLNELADHEIVKKRYPALGQAAACIAAPHIRNIATIGGNICLDAKCWYYNQSPLFFKGRAPCYKRGGDKCYVVQGGEHCYGIFAADTVPALIALGANVTIINSKGKRSVPIRQFYTGEVDPVNILGNLDLVGEIQIPTLKDRTISRFSKYARRNSIDFGIACVAVAITFNRESSVCGNASIALSSVSSSPVYAQKASGMLTGNVINEKLIDEVAATAVKEIKPVSSIWASVYERRHVVASLVKRTLSEIVSAD